jgi:integrase
VPAVAGQLLTAESRVIALAEVVGRIGCLPATLPWIAETTKSPDSAPGAVTVAGAVEALQAEFWAGKVRTSAAERTWQRIESELKRLPPRATLTVALLVAVAGTTTAGSRSRLEACKVYKRLAKLAGLSGLEALDAIRTPYEASERQLPTDADLAELLERIGAHQRYGWMSWALVTFGCRPAEVFSLQPQGDGTARVLSVKRKGKLPTWRTAMALPVAEAPGPRSVTWDVNAPARYDSLEAKRLTGAWGVWLKGQAPGLQLYDLRHAWAIRSIRQGVPTGLAAKCMGHDIAIHSRTYHRWLDQADVAAFIASRQG